VLSHQLTKKHVNINPKMRKRKIKNPTENVYNARPLVVHRAHHVTQAELVKRKTKIAKKRLLQKYIQSGKKLYRSKSVNSLITRSNNSSSSNNQNESILITKEEQIDRDLYNEVTKEIMEALHIGGGLNPVEDEIKVPQTTLTRQERIMMHKIKELEAQRQKSGGVPPPIVDYIPPVPASTLHRLKQLNLAEKKLSSILSKKIDKRINPLVKPSKEMLNACKTQIYGKQIKRNDDYSLHHDFWENRLTSQLARPLGIEAFIQINQSKSEFISDNSVLDSKMYREVDQTERVERAHAAGRPVLRKPKEKESVSFITVATTETQLFAYNTASHQATIKIQRAARIRRKCTEAMSIKIQSMFRAFLVYRVIVRERRRHNLAAACIQCIHRGYQGRRLALWAAFILKIQQIGRCWLARRYVSELRARRNGINIFIKHVQREAGKLLFVYKHAARRIQREWRWTLLWGEKRLNASITMQNISRFFLYKMRKLYLCSATVIQKYTRRYMCSKFYKKLVQNCIKYENDRYYNREVKYVMNQCEIGRKNILKYINGPCGIPILSKPFWLCLGKIKRNGRRYYKLIRKQMKKNRIAHYKLSLEIKKYDTMINKKRKKAWLIENKERKRMINANFIKFKREERMMNLQNKRRKKKYIQLKKLIQRNKKSIKYEFKNVPLIKELKKIENIVKSENKKLTRKSKKVMYKEWFEKKIKLRTLRNLHKRYITDYIVWSYCSGDGTLHANELPSVLRELGACDQYTFVFNELFDNQEDDQNDEEKGEQKDEHSYSSSATVPSINTPTTNTSTTTSSSKNNDTVDVMSVPPLPPLSPLLSPSISSSTSSRVKQIKSVTRKEFQLFWFGNKRMNELQKYSIKYCPSSKCIASRNRKHYRCLLRSTLYTTGTTLTRWTKRRILAETDRRIRNDSIQYFRTKPDPYFDFPSGRLTYLKKRYLNTTSSNNDQKRLYNAPRFQCNQCLKPFLLWRQYKQHCKTCENDVCHASALQFKFKHIKDFSCTENKNGNNNNSNNSNNSNNNNNNNNNNAVKKKQGAVPKFKDVTENNWMNHAVAVINCHLEDIATFASSSSSSENKEVDNAKYEFRRLAWSLGVIEGDNYGMTSDQLKIITRILWNDCDWSENRHQSIYRILTNGTANRNDRIAIPYDRVLEFWLGERVYQNSLVPRMNDNNIGKMMRKCCYCNRSTIHSRWKHVVDREQLNGIMKSVETCARHHYYTELGKKLVLQQQQEDYIEEKQEDCKEDTKKEEININGAHLQFVETKMYDTDTATNTNVDFNKQNRYSLKSNGLLMSRSDATLKYPQWIVLHALGYTLEMSVYALRVNNGSLEESEKWLLNQTFQQLHSIQNLLSISTIEGDRCDLNENETKTKPAIKKCSNNKKENGVEEGRGGDEKWVEREKREKEDETKKDLKEVKLYCIQNVCKNIYHNVVELPVRKSNKCCQAINNRIHRKTIQLKKDKLDVQDVLNNVIQQIIDREGGEQNESTEIRNQEYYNKDLLTFYPIEKEDDDEEEQKKCIKERLWYEEEEDTKKEEQEYSVMIDTPLVEQSMEHVLRSLLETMSTEIMEF
jgi:hypothetical protein